MSVAISAKVTDSAGAVGTAFASAALNTSTATIGETIITPTDDGGNANLLIAQQATLAQAGTILNLSFYVTTPAGKLRLGIYDATGPSGGPGKKIAETAEITPIAGWNTANVIKQVALAAGNYWLAYLPSSGGLGFRNTGNGSSKWYTFAYGTMPATFATAGLSSGGVHWSFYATMQVSVPAPQQLTLALGVSAVSGAPDGTTGGAGTFPANSLVTVTATPNSGLGFVSWSDAGGNVLSTSQSYTFALVQNMSLVANMNWITGKQPPSGGALIPANRVTVWQPGVTYNAIPAVGAAGNTVPSNSSSPGYGIPVRNTIFTTLSPVGGGGDDGAPINAALAACPPGQVVKLTTGVFNLLTNIRYLPSAARGLTGGGDITLRGSGPGAALNFGTSPVGGPGTFTADPTATQLYYGNTAQGFGPAVNLNGADTEGTYGSITDLASDAIQGSYTCTLVSSPGLVVGQIVKVDQFCSGSAYLTQSNDPDIWWGPNNGPPGDTTRFYFNRGDRVLAQVLEVASIANAGKTITFTTPFHHTMCAGAGVSVTGVHGGKAQLCTFGTNAIVWGMGLEELQVAFGLAGGNGSIVLNGCAYSWVKHVESYWSNGASVLMENCFRSEVRDSFIHESSSPNPGGAGYLMDLQWGTSDCLVENCIFWNGNKQIVGQATGGGNVIAYCYGADAFGQGYPSLTEAGLNMAHMCGSHMELMEGCESHRYDADTYWGNIIDMTVLRCNLTGLRPAHAPLNTYTTSGQPYVDGDIRAGVSIGAYAYRQNIVGCVLGYSGQSLIVDPPWVTQTRFNYEELDVITDAAEVMMYYIGSYQGPSSTLTMVPGSYATHLRQGNWDWYTASQHWHGIGGSVEYGNPPNVTKPPIPPSLYLNGTPAFFSNGGYRWPWVDPYTGTTYTLPAKARFVAGTPNTL